MTERPKVHDWKSCVPERVPRVQIPLSPDNKRVFMQDLQQRFAALGIAIPEIMLPKSGVDLQKWAVIACDQFTQDRAYWAEVEGFVGEAPSTLNLIFPEIYIGDQGRENRILNIHQAMNTYLSNGIFAAPRQGMVYVERTTSYQRSRRGLVVAADLEQYDWKGDARFLIRTTEGTVAERLPPRMAVRRGAALECSHVLLLIEDEDDVLLPSLGERARADSPVYHTPLAGGMISGWFLNRETDGAYLAERLEALAQKALGRYGAPPFLYAVGDGNHSLASAKAIWEEYKMLHAGEVGLMDHPSRYALVEIENLYDPGIGFEPIHRLLLGADMAEVLTLLSKLPGFTCRAVQGVEELGVLVGDERAAKTRLGLIGDRAYMLIESDVQGLATDHLQPLLDGFIAGKGRNYSIDYIHGYDALFGRTYDSEHPGVGMLLPPLKKGGLFKTVATHGPLPRKSFSMGEAQEKRFYLECRKLF